MSSNPFVVTDEKNSFESANRSSTNGRFESKSKVSRQTTTRGWTQTHQGMRKSNLNLNGVLLVWHCIWLLWRFNEKYENRKLNCAMAAASVALRLHKIFHSTSALSIWISVFTADNGCSRPCDAIAFHRRPNQRKSERKRPFSFRSHLNWTEIKNSNFFFFTVESNMCFVRRNYFDIFFQSHSLVSCLVNLLWRTLSQSMRLHWNDFPMWKRCHVWNARPLFPNMTCFGWALLLFNFFISLFSSLRIESRQLGRLSTEKKWRFEFRFSKWKWKTKREQKKKKKNVAPQQKRLDFLSIDLRQTMSGLNG